MVKFSSVNHLSLYFPKNFSFDNDESTVIYYIGLKGEFMTVRLFFKLIYLSPAQLFLCLIKKKANRQQVVITNYESRANPADHKVEFGKNVFSDVM
jgi:hypothetical protein